MSEFNFDRIKNIEIPDSWVEKALLLPEKVEDKKVLYFSKYSRPLVAVACLFLVCALSVSLFFFTQRDDILKTDPDYIFSTDIDENSVSDTKNSESVKSETEYTSETEFTDTSTECETQEPQPQEETEDSVNETSDPNASSPNGVICNPNGSRPDEGELNSGGVSAGSKPNSKPTTKPNSKPTEKPTVKPTSPVITPTETKPVMPTQKPKNIIFIGSVKVEGAWGVNDVDVYCKVFDSNGNLLGSEDLFDWQHEAQFDREINNIEYYSYCASEKGLTFTQGYYTYVFYRRNGSVICSGTQYVS